MSRRLSRNGVALCLTLAVAVLGLPARAQKPKDLLWTHAFDLSVRKNGEAEFTKDTQKFGIEVFKDTNTGLGVYISQVGCIALAPGFQNVPTPIPKSQGATWFTGLDIPCRKAGESDFTKDTKVHSMEVYLDPNTNDWVYATEKGLIAVTAAKGPAKAAAGAKAPRWLHSVDLRVRKGGNPEWKDAVKYGIEVYHDLNNGNLIYICETGSVAVLPGGDDVKPAPEGKAPDWLHGLDLLCRKSNEPDFSKDTRKFGVEVFRDENNSNLIFLSETGNLTVTPGGKALKAPTAKVQAPKYLHGLTLKCRKVGEKDFSAATQAFGAEAFLDPNLGTTIYIAETGVIAALGK